MTEIDAQADDARMAAALRQYQAELDAGRRPDRTVLLAEFPDLAGPLTEAMDGLDFLFRAASPKLPPAQVRQLGDFRLIREIGRGGMGVVYEAEQVSLGRRVALKVLPTAAALDARQRRRFLHEAQAAAHLHHTNIVPVFAVGCDRGIDYYAMQYIDGPTLADVIQDLRGEAGLARESGSGTGSWSGSGSGGRRATTKPELPIAARTEPTISRNGETRATHSTTIPRPGPDYFKSLARLGLQAAEALDYAHSTGVVHRDIKPANLLVDARGNLWVTDFGLALCHGVGNLTISGDVLGTLRYMSPEQARGGRGNVDHQSDVYSLGVTLYELFTLHHPYPGREREEILRQILTDDPKSPRRMRTDLPTELETVVMKAAAKAPPDRYATAGELADDLRRFLDDKPVLARRPTLGQIAAKWARRHRGLVWAAFAGLVLGCVCLSVALWLLDAEQQRTYAALNRATANWQEARKAVDTMYTEAAEKLLTDQSLKRDFLMKALAFYEQFAAEGGDDTAVRFDRAKASVRVGEIQFKLGNYRESGAAYAAALPVLEALATDTPASVEYRRELASCLNGRAILLLSTGKPDDAAAGFRRAIAEQNEILRLAPGDRKARFDLSKHAGNLGVVLLNQGRYDEAEANFLDALRSAEAYLAATPQPAPADRQHVAHTRYNAGVVFYSTDRPDQAREHWQEARRVRQELVKQFPFDPKYEEDLASTSLAMGALSYQVRRFEESEELFRDAVTRFARLLAQSPTSPSYRAEHGRGLHSLARALSALGKLSQADDALRVGQETLEKAAADFPEAVAIRLDVIRTRIDRVNLLYKAGRAAEADALAARAWSEASDGPTRLPAAPEEQYHRMILRNNMAEHAWGRGRLDEAERWFREASQIGDTLTTDPKVLAQHRWTYCGVLSNASRLALSRGQIDAADAVVRTWLAHCDRLLAGPGRRIRWQADRAWVLTRLAEVREKQNRLADATELRRTAGEALDGVDAADDADGWMAAAWFLALRPELPERDLARARTLAEKAVAKEPSAADAWRTLGLVHLRQDRAAEAVVVLVRAQQASGGQDRVTEAILALAYKAAGETALADQTYDQMRAKVAASGETGEELDEFRAEAKRVFGR